MNKPRIVLWNKPCDKALGIIRTVADTVEETKEFDYVWTGLAPVVTDVPVFSPCTGVEHIQAPKIIHLDAEWKESEGYKITSTAEHTLSLILQLAKKKGIQLRAKRIAIIGFGRIGKMVYSMCENLVGNTERNSRIDVYDVWHKPFIKEDFYYSNVPSHSDIITLHIPLNDETYHMIGKEEIAEMKDRTLLINTSRQEVVDIKAVKEALISGKIYYADDFRNNVDLTMYGAIQTDHIGGNCVEARESTDIYIAKQFVNYIKNMGDK